MNNSQANPDRQPQWKKEHKITSFLTPAKLRRYHQLWHKASSTATAESQTIKGDDPSSGRVATPEKRRRYQQLWHKATTAVAAEVQAVKDGNPSVVVICPQEVVEFLGPANNTVPNSSQQPTQPLPAPVVMLGLAAALLPAAVRFAQVYRKVAQCEYSL